MFTSVPHNLLQKLFKVQTLIVLNKRRFLRFNRFDLIIGTSSIVCGAGSVQLSGVRPSVRPSIRLFVCPFVLSGHRTPQLRVCCCGPGGGQEISIDSSSDGDRVEMCGASRSLARTATATRLATTTSTSRS